MERTSLIKLKDGIEVEVELKENQVMEISNNINVDSSLEQLQELLSKIVKPISNTYKELNKDISIESAKINIGIKIGVEGNFILAKSSAGANISVELTMKAKND